MMQDLGDRQRGAVLGALVADAAAMGLHWIYDQDHLRKIAPEAPEFHTPDAANYQGVAAYFAHGGRSAGAPSQYGEQLLVMMRALLKTGGHYAAHNFAEEFRAHFGYGGTYVGYIDHATRDTLDNFRRAEDAALSRAQQIPFDGDASVTKGLAEMAVQLRARHRGDALSQAFAKAVRARHDDPALQDHGQAVLEAVLAGPAARGARDQQLPAIAKLPPLVAVLAQTGDYPFAKSIETAVQITSNHERSAAFGLVCGVMMRVAIGEGDLEAALTAAQGAGTGPTKALLADALARTSEDTNAVTRHFGMACDLNYGVPSAVHNMATATSFEQAVRRNILAGGDNCGRAILVGAVMGAVHGIGGESGIPQAWIDRLQHREEVFKGLETLFG